MMAQRSESMWISSSKKEIKQNKGVVEREILTWRQFFFQQLLAPPPSPILPNVVYFDHMCYVSVTSKSHYVTHFEENQAVANI